MQHILGIILVGVPVVAVIWFIVKNWKKEDIRQIVYGLLFFLGFISFIGGLIIFSS